MFRIHLITFRGTKLNLVIKPIYATPRPIISIGCDCHPAYLLESLGIRDASYPFDWLNTEPIKGIDYVLKNLQSGFKYFVADLHRNHRGHVISGNHTEAEFFHYPTLPENPELRETLIKRASRFVKTLDQTECDLLFNLPSSAIPQAVDVEKFLASVNSFLVETQNRHRLLIYLRHDESSRENKENSEDLAQNLRRIPQVSVSQYVREKSVHGLWGNEKEYTKLLRALGVKLRIQWARIYFEKEYPK